MSVIECAILFAQGAAGGMVGPFHLPAMRVPRWIVWLLLYAAAVFCWIVFFEHGPGRQRFLEGAQTELSRLWTAIKQWTGSK